MILHQKIFQVFFFRPNFAGADVSNEETYGTKTNVSQLAKNSNLSGQLEVVLIFHSKV